jgi:hypothetical protein
MSHYPPFAALANFPPPWTEHNPEEPQGSLSTETLLEILDGMPRSFPFLSAAVTIDGVDWDGTGSGLAAGPAPDEHPPAPGFGRYLFPSITLSDNTRRNFEAVIEVSVDRPRPADSVVEKLIAIGRIASERRRVRYDGVELAEFLERRQRALAFVESFKAGLSDWLAAHVSLPADLPPAIGSASEEPFSVKPALLAAVGPLGYRYVAIQSGEGMSVLEKRTPARHRLQLAVDRGSWSRRLTCTFSFSAIETHHALELPVHVGQTVHGYPVEGQATVDAAVANWAAMLPAIERDFVGALTAIYRADPPWA